MAVSDDGKPIATAKLTRQVMDYCRSLDIPVIEHAEDLSLAAGAVMREGVTSTRLGLAGMPAAAESVCVARDVQLAELTGARLHIAHLSARGSLDQVRWAKSRGLHVSCEVTPHHFTLIDEDVQYDSRFKMNPPLAAREDRDASARRIGRRNRGCHRDRSRTARASAEGCGVRSRAIRDSGIRDGDCIVARTACAPRRISLMRMVELFTTGPARVLGMERTLAAGEPADITIFSTDHAWTYDVKDSPSKSRNSPFDQREFKGAPMATVVAGRIVWKR